MFKTFLLVGASAMALAASSAGAVTFAYTGAAQSFTAAATGIYDVYALGAGGGNVRFKGGRGASVEGHIALSAGSKLSVIVGGQGGSGSPTVFANAGGGGGTFIASGSTPLIVAGGGGGAGQYGGGDDAAKYASGTAGGNAFNTTGHTGGSGGYAGTGGTGGTGGRGNGGGGAGVYGGGGHGGGADSGGGGSSSPSYAGGSGINSSTTARSIGGFGGGGVSSGGGGGGWSGGGGGSYQSGGGGGGSAAADSVTDGSINWRLNSGNGSASINAVRLFATPTLSTNTLDFGVVRGGSPAQQRSVTIANAVIADPASDKLVTVLGSLPATVTSSAASASIAAGQSNTIAFSLSAMPGSTSADVGLAFTSHATTGDDINLGSSTVHITGTVTDLAVAVIVGKGDGLLTFKNGHYVLDLGDVAANSGVRSTLVSMLNGVTYSAYSERLNGYYSGLSSDGFSLALRNPINIADDGQPPVLLGQTEYVEGGKQTDLGLLGFDPTGLSLGRHSRTIDFYALTTFGNFPAYGGPDAPITVEANVTAGVPVAGVPEPATWGLLTAGFGMIGAAMRRRKLRLA